MSRRVMRGVAMMMLGAEAMRQRAQNGARGKHGLNGGAHISTASSTATSYEQHS